jgi:hypothetical protein
MKTKSPPESLPQDEPHTVKVIRLKKVDRAILDNGRTLPGHQSDVLIEAILAALDERDDGTGGTLCWFTLTNWRSK